ncbi:uncharacterized protein LOC134222196 [Armigeres subalbatus]|uniref:uncharacterized protein LOC134222196 n=1 Tax=Armigeres subalbatus TaxID=124917 RepID=UPI002ED473FA
MLEKSFQLREEMVSDDGSDTRSELSERNSRRKVEDWQRKQNDVLSSTIGVTTPNKTDTGIPIETTTTSRIEESQGGDLQPTGVILDRALAGINLEDSARAVPLGGMIGRTSEVVKHTGAIRKSILPVAPPVSSSPIVSGNKRYSLEFVSPPPLLDSSLNNLNNNNITNSPPISSQIISGLTMSNHARNDLIAIDSVNHDGTSNRVAANPPVREGLLSKRFEPLPSSHQELPPAVLQSERYHGERMSTIARQPILDPNMGPASNGRPNGWGPSPQQIAARQVISKDLLTFTGNPEDWPLFISSFINSTDACGYSDAENLARLQRCLKGNALEAVRSRLLLPSSVPSVIATLETLYGRPELLIYTLLQKVRGTPAPKQDRLETLIGYGMAVQSLSDHLVAGGHQAHLDNPMLLFELMDKLPASMKLDWSLYKQWCTVVNILSFSQYMATLVRAATDVTLHCEPKQPQQLQQRGEKGNKDRNFCGAHSTEEATKVPREEDVICKDKTESSCPLCLICKDPNHRVKNCTVFARKRLDERWKLTELLGLCRICLGLHGKRPCRIRQKCEIDGCQLRHHSLLHSKQGISESKQEEMESKPGPSSAITNHHFVGKAALFRIIPVELHGNDRSVTAYAFLDDGSAKTLVDEEIAKELGVTGETLPLCLQWTANVKRVEANSQQVALEISGEGGEARFPLRDVRTVRKLDLPRQSLRYSELAQVFPYLQGLPIKGYENALPRILIGNDNAHVTAMLKVREGQPGEPIAAKSRLGWTVHGSQIGGVTHAHSFHICECRDDEKTLQDLLKQYFAVESLGVDIVAYPESEEVRRAKQILENTTKRVGQRFETGLLWKYECFEFPDSYAMAVRRLKCLERRISRDPVVGESVLQQWSEYQAKGYVHKATPRELEGADPKRTWYLPLGIAINPKKPSKIRIFCDAAAKVDGISLNTMLLKGPDLLNTLLDVLFGFREKRIALCADLKEMFHQIQIRPEDRHSQRLLWREDSTKSPDVYLMDVATFGAACSPCSAQFVKNRNAKEHSLKYPKAADAIVRKHYVDDYLDSADTIEEAVKIALEVRHVHSLGGFHLRNWLSNSKEVLERVGENDTAIQKSLQLDSRSATERVLGMFWKPEEDVFTFSTKLAIETQHPTKRQALRVVMSPFDPAGLLCFYLVHGKILIQKLWRAKTDWDQQIPIALKENWTRWTDLFQHLGEVRVPRCYFPHHALEDLIELQLHIFVDASEEAYACVAYFRAEFPGGVELALVGGKSKVAPLNTVSIPRLELMAATIGVRFLKSTRNGHSLKIDKAVLWSDSKTVLAWINADHRNYRQFVACRVGEILSKSDVEQWRWVPTKENPADLATKWGKGPCLSPSGLWFRGPAFLCLPEDKWPNEVKPSKQTTEEELRLCLVHTETTVDLVIDWARFSNWTRLLRSVAFALRFSQNLRKKVKKQATTAGPLTQQELVLAELVIFRMVQSEQYSDEVAVLHKERNQQMMPSSASLERTSKIRNLTPYIDDDGVLRSESRISAATFVSHDTRFPIILPKEHLVTRLLIQWYHRRFLHANGETVVNEVRQRFHVPALRAQVRKAAKSCHECKVKKAVPEVPRMAPLPAARLKPYERPFSYVGLDYFGPIAVRVNRSTVKRWIALFTCLTTRAVHLEIAHSLSTESCKQAVRRFIGRRGSPVEIRSDRGTNFVGRIMNCVRRCPR